jgi:hypothetical protein
MLDKAYFSTRDDMLFRETARILTELIEKREYGLPIGVHVRDADGRQVWGEYHWDPKNFSLAFVEKGREGRGKFKCPVLFEFHDGTGEGVATALLEEELGRDGGKFKFELRGA